MTFPEFIERALLVGIPLLGTGGWLGYIIGNQGKRLQAVEKAVSTKASAEDLEALEKALPGELDKRLRTLETDKLGATEHARFCAMTLKSVETMVVGLKATVEQHAARLAKGDDLFRELHALAAELKASLREARNNHNNRG
jgi:hypothetical protein